MQFEKEKVFQLVLDSSVILEESQDSDIYGSQMKSKLKRFSGYNETSFDSLNTVDHLFVTGSAQIESEDFALLLNQEESATKVDRKLAKSNKKISRLKETLKKETDSHSHRQN